MCKSRTPRMNRAISVIVHLLFLIDISNVYSETVSFPLKAVIFSVILEDVSKEWKDFHQRTCVTNWFNWYNPTLGNSAWNFCCSFDVSESIKRHTWGQTNIIGTLRGAGPRPNNCNQDNKGYPSPTQMHTKQFQWCGVQWNNQMVDKEKQKFFC